jgi:predicted RNase H-like HicB family nuclease
MDKFGYRVFWSDEDQGYLAVSPVFPRLSSFGVTAEDALAGLRTLLQDSTIRCESHAE